MSFVTDHILKNPPVLLGLIAMIGLIVQRKPFCRSGERLVDSSLWDGSIDRRGQYADGNDRTNQHSGSDTVGGSSSRWSF